MILPFVIILIIIIIAIVIDIPITGGLFPSRNLPEELRETFIELFRDKNSKPIVTIDDIEHSLKYTASGKQILPQVHLGQRKLLLSEIQFMTHVDSPYVLYAGSAPGKKNYILSDLFPGKKFIMVDPNKFEISVPSTNKNHRQIRNDAVIHIYYNKTYDRYRNNANKYGKNKEINLYSKRDWDELIDFIQDTNYRIYIIEDYMNDVIAKNLAKLHISFISDIRTNILNNPYPQNIDIYWNMAMQYKWMCSMGAERSLTKMRIPFGNNNPEYAEIEMIQPEFEGTRFKDDYINNVFAFPKSTLYIQAWPGKTSNEMRFLTLKEDLNNFIEYDVGEIENKFFYYNNINRGFICHDNPNASRELHFCRCNDCALENVILTDYIEKYDGYTVHELIRFIDSIGRSLHEFHVNNIWRNYTTDDIDHFIKTINADINTETKRKNQLGNVGKAV